MKLLLKNIGKINTASVEISGITVIAGENNTGKSTVGRTLFAVFNSFYHIQEQIAYERFQTIEHLLTTMYRSYTNRLSHRSGIERVAQDIIEHIDVYKDNSSAVTDLIMKSIFRNNENTINTIDNKRIDQLVSRIRTRLLVPDTDIFLSVLERKLEAEFNGQVNNIYADDTGEIILSIRGADITVTIEDNSIKDVTGDVDLRTEAVYIDDPFVIDEVPFFYIPAESNYLDHREHLKTKLDRGTSVNVIEEIVANKKLEKINNKISAVCSGNIVRDKHSSLGYQRNSTDAVLDVRNLSTGFKTFAILKTLLLNGIIEDNGTIILDEPEIHLHPEWQLLFAELIVLIQKEFGVHILLNTHSPYFLNAIEVYAAKYGVDDKCRYYLAVSSGDISNIENVTNNIEAIYKKLARPLQDLENERGRL